MNRSQFPSLSRLHNGKPLIFMDGPAGTQVPDYVINAMSDYYKKSNANTHGAFVTTQETDTMLSDMRKTVAEFLGAPGPENISVGQNMTTLNFSLARGIGRMLQPGDEIIITQLDHEGNRGPWLSLREQGIIVREVKLLDNGLLDYADFESKINERTRLVAMGMASNSIGTVNDFKLVRKLTYRYNAWLLLDAVHYAPHFSIDVQEIGCDFLLCSAYKFYGPHVGILYSKSGLLDQIPTDRLRTAGQSAPEKIETGTLNHAALVGVKAAIEFISQQGNGNSLREKIMNACESIGKHERALAEKLYNGLSKISGVKIIGQPFTSSQRSPTISFLKEGKTASEVCTHLAAQNICAWDGHFYAIRSIEVLGLLEKGGVTRMGISAYNTEEEIEMVVEAVRKI
jgi:cysteine desulfurase family protein (TIGR01976 family)